MFSLLFLFLKLILSLSSTFGCWIINNRNARVRFILNRDIGGGGRPGGDAISEEASREIHLLPLLRNPPNHWCLHQGGTELTGKVIKITWSWLLAGSKHYEHISCRDSIALWHVIDQSILLFVKSQICCKKLIDSRLRSAKHWNRRSWQARSLPTWGSCLDQVARFGAWCPDVQSGGCAKRKRWKWINFNVYVEMNVCTCAESRCHKEAATWGLWSGQEPNQVQDIAPGTRQGPGAWDCFLESLFLFRNVT